MSLSLRTQNGLPDICGYENLDIPSLSEVSSVIYLLRVGTCLLSDIMFLKSMDPSLNLSDRPMRES